MDEINTNEKQKKQMYWLVAVAASCMFSIGLLELDSGDEDRDRMWDLFWWSAIIVGGLYGMLSPKGTSRKAFRAGCLTYLAIFFIVGLFFCDVSNQRKLIGIVWAVANYLVFEVVCAPLLDNKKKFAP